MHDVFVPANAAPLDVSVRNVSHFFVDVPTNFGVAPSTPKLTTVEVNTIASDHSYVSKQCKRNGSISCR